MKYFLLIVKYFVILLVKVRRYMAGRPRLVKFEDGEVSLSGFTPERADELSALLKSEKPAQALEVVADKPLVGEMKETALGIYHDLTKKCFFLVQVKYNPDTKEAIVEQVTQAGEWRAMAASVFKQECVRKNLV